MCASKFSASVIQVFQVGVQFVDKFVDKNGDWCLEEAHSQ